jgi:hypothetical protein
MSEISFTLKEQLSLYVDSTNVDDVCILVISVKGIPYH